MFEQQFQVSFIFVSRVQAPRFSLKLGLIELRMNLKSNSQHHGKKKCSGVQGLMCTVQLFATYVFTVPDADVKIVQTFLSTTCPFGSGISQLTSGDSRRL